MDALLAEKIDQDQIFPKRGKTLMFKLNNERIRVKGTSGFPCDLLVNGLEATMDTPIVNEDKITLTPAILGEEGNAFIKDYIELKDIKVTSKKPLFEQKSDRMVVNVRNSITSAGSTVLEVLERSPGVMVDHLNNSLSIAGKNGVTIMINGKITNMPMSAIVQMLAGMSASNI